MLNEQCGNCKFASIVKEDLTKRVCHGAPPQIVPLPIQNSLGQMGINLAHHWPLVEVTGQICALYKTKPVTDN